MSSQPSPSPTTTTTTTTAATKPFSPSDPTWVPKASKVRESVVSSHTPKPSLHSSNFRIETAPRTVRYKVPLKSLSRFVARTAGKDEGGNISTAPTVFDEVVEYRDATSIAAEGAENGQLLPGEKEIVFIRHGESVANAAHAEEDKFVNPKYKDAVLTSTGEKQAQAIQSIVDQFQLQVVFVSPMRRTLSTGAHVFKNSTVSLVAWDLLTEFYPEAVETNAYRLDDPLVQEHIKSLPREVVLDNVAEDWWNEEFARDIDRISQFLSWFSHSPLTRIGVVTHWGFIHRVLEAVRFEGDMEIENCQPIKIHLSPPRPIPSFPSYSIRLYPSPTHPKNKQNPFLTSLNKFYSQCRQDFTLQTASSLSLHCTLVDFLPIAKRDISALRKKISETKANLYSAESPWSVPSGEVQLEVDDDQALFVRLSFTSSSLMEFVEVLKSVDPLVDNAEVVRGKLHLSVLRDDHPEGRSLSLGDFQEAASDDSRVKDLLQVGGGGQDSWRDGVSDIVWDLVIVGQSGETMTFPLYKTLKPLL